MQVKVHGAPAQVATFVAAPSAVIRPDKEQADALAGTQAEPVADDPEQLNGFAQSEADCAPDPMDAFAQYCPTAAPKSWLVQAVALHTWKVSVPLYVPQPVSPGVHEKLQAPPEQLPV